MRTRTKESWFVKCFIVASALMLVMAGSACSQTIPCQTYDRSSTDAPQFVRDWLEGDSEAFYVKACGGGDHLLYHGAGNLAHDGNVCRHLSYELDLSSTNPPHLERRLTPYSTATYMLAKECPSPQAVHYVWTSHVRQDVFVDLIHLWNSAISSRASFDRAVAGTSSRAATLDHLRNVISRGQGRRIAADSVKTDLGLRGPLERYELGFTNPDHHDRCYAVLVLRAGRAYVITDVQPCWY
jgi:hypothetical protein